MSFRSSDSFSVLLCKFWAQVILVSRFYKSELTSAPPAMFSLERGRKPRSHRSSAGNSRSRPARPEAVPLPGEQAQLWGVGRDRSESGSCGLGIAAAGTSTDRLLLAGWRTTSEKKSREKLRCWPSQVLWVTYVRAYKDKGMLNCSILRAKHTSQSWNLRMDFQD